jgi:hypothetical protein
MDFDGDFGQIHTWAFFSPSFGSYEGSYRCPQQFMKLAPEAGFEPATSRLTAGCSTIELLWNSNNCSKSAKKIRFKLFQVNENGFRITAEERNVTVG